jgi:hypothetical protein
VALKRKKATSARKSAKRPSKAAKRGPAAKKAPAKKAPAKKARKAVPTKRRGPARITDLERSTYLENLVAQLSEETYHEHERVVEEAKFDLGVPHDERIQAQEIPHEYGLDRVILLVVDPTFVFSYWEVTQASLDEASKHLGADPKLALRFYDTSDGQSPGSCPSWDIEVFDRVGNWYLRLERPDQTLVIDIGLKDDEGRFCAVTRSNYMRTPRPSIAPPGPTTWMTVGPDGEKVVTSIEEYTDADRELLKRILGPHFYGLLVNGQFSSVVGSSMEAVFQDISLLKQPELMLTSSPTGWASHNNKG